MTLETIIVIGILTTVFSLLTKLIGFPDQIKKNYERKSTEGISLWFFLLSFISYALWTAHGILQNDWVVYLGQGLGVITTGAILTQIWIYKRK
ncbi:MAG: SemiSWEET family transporter [Candidatus Staskawiczbacteria bacterium]|nr:SemiSWEET family transporter [Candidatus Staskawiczbacteria bacterium]